MRINKYLAERLGISRRRADDFINLHDVTVNGMTAQSGQDVTDSDTVLVDGKPLAEKKQIVYVLLNKPTGYVCSRDGQGSKTIYDLLPQEYSHLNPVGRLDKESSGLLLLTNDGALHQQLTHPSFQKEKVYTVTLDKALAEQDKKHIEDGVDLYDGPSALSLTLLRRDGKVWQVRMHEGRNRQIRRTFEALGYTITALHRTQFGDYTLTQLQEKAFIQLPPHNRA
jgi:23S rRNA pseudouridine2605 synthase